MEGVSREEAQQAIIDAEASRTGGPFAVSDGNRHAALTARLSGTRVATLDMRRQTQRRTSSSGCRS